MNEGLMPYNPQNEPVVIYRSDDDAVKLEVRLQAETVWLNRQQMAMLFNRDVKTIGKHIKNALQEELAPVVSKNATTQEDPPTIAKFATTAADGKIYKVEYYNLDVVLSVGYRVKSQRGIQFRRWANTVLKEYMLRGQVINEQLLNMERRIGLQLQEHSEQIHDLQNKVDFFVRTSLPPVEQVFYNGEFFEARVLLEKIIKTAQKRVIVIDAYVDAATFEMLDVRKKGVTATIYSGKDLTHLRDLHKESGAAPVDTCVWKTPSHDRWLIVDDSVYHCGHSLKDMGRKLSAVSLLGINAEDILKQVR